MRIVSAPRAKEINSMDEKHAATSRMGTRQRAILLILAVCCVMLIILCGVALATSGDSMQQATGAAVQSDLSVDGQAEDADGRGEPEQDTGDGEASASSSSGQDETSGASSDDASSKQTDSRGGSASHNEGGNTLGATASGGGSGDGGSGGSNSSKPSQGTTVTVSVVIDSSAADGSVSGSGTFTFKEGATPYDVLCAVRSDVDASHTTFGVYVAGIGGLYENDSRYSGVTGWKYSVNGSVIMKAADKYTLHDGDRVVWFYTVTG